MNPIPNVPQFVPVTLVRTVSKKQFLIFGKVVGETRYYSNGQSYFMSNADIAEEKEQETQRLAAEQAAAELRLEAEAEQAAIALRQAEDLALEQKANAEGYNEGLELAIRAAAEIDPRIMELAEKKGNAGKAQIRKGQDQITTGQNNVTYGQKAVAAAEVFGYKGAD